MGSSKGIIKQALTGAGNKYLSIAKEIYKYPGEDSAVGNAFLGGFYNVAPWPIGSKGKARKFLREGVSKAPTRRNYYYAGVNAYQMGEYSDAKELFEKGLKTPLCKSPTSSEEDMFDFVTKELQPGLCKKYAGTGSIRLEVHR